MHVTVTWTRNSMLHRPCSTRV